MTEKGLLKRIVIDPKVMLGKPVIKGTRLPVEIIVGRNVRRKLASWACRGALFEWYYLTGKFSPVGRELPKIAYGATTDDLHKDYPFLKKEDIRAALLYAAKRVANEEIYEA